jgi:hypothetical protein
MKFRKSNEVHTLIPANGRKCKQTAVSGILKYLALPYYKNWFLTK